MEEQLFASLNGKPGVGALPDGVHYIIVKTGTGIRPNEKDTVEINAIGVFPDGTLFEDICPHTRDQGCECIKPKPYFVLKASQEFNLDLSRSFVVGDYLHDMELSQQVGATGIYLLTGHGRKHVEEIITAGQAFVARNLNEAVTWILGKHGSDPQRTA